MLKQYRNRRFWIALFSFLMLAGCSQQDGGQKSSTALFSKVDPSPVVISPQTSGSKKELERIKKNVMTVDSSYDAAVARKDKEVLVSYKVKHSKRFQMKKIEKEVTKKLEKNYPDYTFLVSSDYKIFLEIVRLGEKMEQPNFSKKKAEKRFKEIKTLKDELT